MHKAVVEVAGKLVTLACDSISLSVMDIFDGIAKLVGWMMKPIEFVRRFSLSMLVTY